MFSRTAKYALRAVLTIADESQGGLVDARHLAARLGVPHNYLTKTLHQLARAGVLKSTRGRAGGFELARPADRLTLLEIIGLFDEIKPPRLCLLGRPVCSDRTACRVHERWKQVSGRLTDFFRETTVAELLRVQGEV